MITWQLGHSKLELPLTSFPFFIIYQLSLYYLSIFFSSKEIFYGEKKDNLSAHLVKYRPEVLILAAIKILWRQVKQSSNENPEWETRRKRNECGVKCRFGVGCRLPTVPSIIISFMYFTNLVICKRGSITVMNVLTVQASSLANPRLQCFPLFSMETMEDHWKRGRGRGSRKINILPQS